MAGFESRRTRKKDLDPIDEAVIEAERRGGRVGPEEVGLGDTDDLDQFLADHPEDFEDYLINPTRRRVD